MEKKTTILGLVDREAKRRLPADPLAALAATATGEWAEAETTLLPRVLADPGRAERLVLAFSRVAAAAGSREGRARAARLHGSWLSYVGRFEASLPLYETAAGLLSGAPRDGARLGIAGSLLRLGRFDEAIAICRRIRASASRRKDVAIAGGADLNQAVALHESGRPEKALDLYERARKAFEATGHGGMAATALQNEANALVLLDRYEEATPRYEAAAVAFESAGAANEAARCRYNRGALFVATDRLGAADEALFAEEQVFRRLGDRVHAALCRLDRGEALLRAGLIPEARAALTTARRRLARGAPPVERTRAALLLARAHLAAGDVAAARRLLSRPLALLDAFEGDRAELLALAGAAGRPGPAADRLLAAARRFGRRRPVAAIRARLAAAACAFDDDDTTAAWRILESTRARLAEFPLPGLRFGESALTFLVEDRRGRHEAAEAALVRSVDDLADVRAGLGNAAFRAALLRGREQWLARAVRHRLAESGDRALELLDQWRSRALVDLLGEADRVAPRNERLAALRGRVAVLERRIGGGLLPGFLRASEAGEDAALLQRLTDAEAELAEAQRRSMPEAALVAPDAMRRRLPAGTVALSLFTDGDGTLVFATDRHGTEVHSGPAVRGEVAALTDELHFLLGQFTIGDAFVRRHGERLERRTSRILDALARIALAPAAGIVRRSKHVVIIPHGAWHRVPFAALPLDGRLLIHRRSIGLAPSLAALHRPPRPARGRSVVLACPDEAAPLIAREGREVAAVLPRSDLFEGGDATAARLVDRSAPACLHIAGHGTYRADAPAMSGVRLADGWLRAIDLPGLPLRGSTLVLSGCQTGVTTAGEGDEVQGLVRGAFAAGCAELVASLWPVDDASTARLFREFYRGRARGSSSAAALATAQRAMAGDGLHPFYWAGFMAWSRRPDSAR